MRKISGWLLGMSLILVGCNSSQIQTIAPTQPTVRSVPAQDNETQTKPLVVTTVAPLTNIVSNIAGDRAEVRGLIPEGTDSHTYEIRTADAELLSKAKLILVNGLNLESPTQKLASLVKLQDTKIYPFGDRAITPDEWMFDFSFPKAKGDPNPHLWVNPKYAEKYARLAAQWLTELDPLGAEYYATNLQHYVQRLEQLDSITRAVVASIPAHHRKLLTYHDSWAYWSREYGFQVIGAAQPDDFSEPSAQEIAQLTAQIRQVGVPAIFGSEVYPSQVEEQIARQAHVKTANTADDSLPGAGSANAMINQNPRHTYLGMMAENLSIIATNLGGDPNLVQSLNTANVVGPTATAQTSQ